MLLMCSGLMLITMSVRENSRRSLISARPDFCFTSLQATAGDRVAVGIFTESMLRHDIGRGQATVYGG